jgi:hypothetical protein
VVSITQPGDENNIVAGSINLPARSVQVNVTPYVTLGNFSAAASVIYTNQLVQGDLEICKSAPSGSALTGNYTFTVTAPNDTTDGSTSTTSQVGGFSTSVVVSVGQCSPAIPVPAGHVTTTEPNGPGAANSAANTTVNVTGVIASENGVNELVSQVNDTTGATGSAVVNVAGFSNAITNTASETLETFTNDVVQLKLCKVWDGSLSAQPSGVGTLYPFALSAVGPAGPSTIPSSISLTAGTAAAPFCQLINLASGFRAGTQVTITEGIVPGTKVESIVDSQSAGTPAATSSTTDRTTTVILGPGQTTVTYTNQAAAPGELKVCASPGTVPGAPNSPSTFTVTDASVTASPLTVVINYAGTSTQCEIVGGTATPTLFPFNSTATVATTNSNGNLTTGIVVTPVDVVENGTANTDQPVVVSQTIGTTTGSAASVSVLIGENVIPTIATFGEVDPPFATITTGDGSVTPVSTGTGVSIVAPVITGSTSTAASTFTSSIGNSSTITSSTSVGVTATTVKTLTAAQRKAALKQDEKTLTNVKASITKWTKTLHNTKGAAHKAAQRKLNSLKAQLKVLNLQIKLLK